MRFPKLVLVVAVASVSTGTAIAVDASKGKSVVAAPSADAGEGAAKDVVAAADAIVAAFGRHDTKAYFASFDPEASFVFYDTAHRLNSRAEWEAEWSKWEKEDAFRVLSCISTDQRVQLLGDAAVFTHTVRTEVSTKQGKRTLNERETIVFYRRGGRWVAVHEHLSPQPEPQPPAKN